jgi:hypothetical protein
MPRQLSAFLLTLALAASPAAAAGPFLVADLNTTALPGKTWAPRG